MNKYDEMRNLTKESVVEIRDNLENFNKIQSETDRVLDVAKKANIIITDLETQFAQATKLNATDITFLLFATALQCLRQYWLTNDKFRFKNDQQAGKTIKKFTPISLIGPVPYDAFKKSGYSNNTGISGVNHRYTTLGHDPLLGWIFGTANILSETVTKNNILLESYNTVLVGNEYKISDLSNIAFVFQCSFERVQNDYKDLMLSVAKHAIHLSSDAFTKYGLPIPIINNFCPNLSSTLIKNGIDIYSVGRGIALSSLINMIVASIHSLFFDPNLYSSRDLYEVKTRKILSYSNAIASSSNIIYVAISAFLGDESALKKLDVGGIIVTIYRLITDYNFIKKVKQEFLEKEFYNIVMGNEFNF